MGLGTILLAPALLFAAPAPASRAAAGDSERSGSFVIEYGNHRFRVVSPARRSPQTTLVLENKTSVGVRGRVETLGGRLLHHVSTPPNEFKTLTITLRKGERAVFIPLSPPLQEVELAFNKPPYEIPPRR